jgi:hypothetical protein
MCPSLDTIFGTNRVFPVALIINAKSTPETHDVYRTIKHPTPMPLCRLLQRACSSNNSQIGMYGRMAMIKLSQ